MNPLSNETSPYLLQHARNPVYWYPWGKTALQKAKTEDKPILLSIGYAACHWCHVMAHESFEDPETARLMNELFVCIKVDREERPDLDQIYMNFVQMTTGSGGWPLNVFLTPNQEPFYGGTYFPPHDHYGRPSWKKVLRQVSNFYHNEKIVLNENLEKITLAFKKNLTRPAGSDLPGKNEFIESVSSLLHMSDFRHGGIGRAPKFPPIQALSLFLRYHQLTRDSSFLDIVTLTLRNMAQGGIYDQLGAGFARYSVDDSWLVPHFEKMLYDNAQLIPLYLDTYLITRDDFYLRIVRETLDFIMREMLSPENGFYSSLDADSEGQEGKFYVWDKTEIENLLGDDSPVFCDFYDVTEVGNFEGKNILHIQTDISATAKRFKLNADRVQQLLDSCREKLLIARNLRVQPSLDDKCLTSWNSLMLSAFARAYQVLGEEKYKHVIIQNIDFIKSKLYKNGMLLRSYNRGKAQYDGYLDDYALLIKALFDVYESLFDISYLEWARELLDYVNNRFWDNKNFGYFYTSSDQEKLIFRMKDEYDQSIPSGNGLMLLNNLRFYSLTDDESLLNLAELLLKTYAPHMRSNPYGYGSYLIGLDFYLQKPKEIVIIYPKENKFSQFYHAIYDMYLPNKIVLAVPGDISSSVLSASLIQNKKPIDGKTTIYVCHDFACSQPVFTPEDLVKLLR